MLPRFLFLLLALIFASGIVPAFGFTENEIRNIFKELDMNGDGKVTRDEYSSEKISVIYRNIPVNPYTTTGGDIKFGETKLSRQFFDAADTDRNGGLSAVEVVNAFKFENIDKDAKGYFTFHELNVFMKKIGKQ